MTDEATLFEVKDGDATVKVAALIGGEGIDLVVSRFGQRPITVQLGPDVATKLSEQIAAAVAESAQL